LESTREINESKRVEKISIPMVPKLTVDLGFGNFKVGCFGLDRPVVIRSYFADNKITTVHEMKFTAFRIGNSAIIQAIVQNKIVVET